jgi:preprotein translocase subunit YajC
MTKLPLFLAQAAPAGSSGGIPTGMMITYGLLFAAMYFLMIAPQRKKQKAHEKLMSELKAGDEIITTGGVYGTITSVKDDRFVVRVSDSQKLEISKGFIHACVKPANAA